ncbi:NnrU family protein [Accumulibacter sp.]|uniref:NnrU family protein n=1 Tax=Accumulibacter sp. TaxID=2053492 RepID=UPI0028C4D69F|nr:NnrU family protein [Accumulibacter sp.]
MIYLLAGLVVFLGVHSLRIFANDWRTRTIGRIGALPWKAAYSLFSIAGFGLIVWGYSLARSEPMLLWSPPLFMRHLAASLTLPALVLLCAAYVPGNAIKARLHHPMVLAVKLWAIAHLLANGTLADVLLFGSFLLWAVFSFSAARRRDRAAGTVYAPGSRLPTLATVVAGSLAWATFAFWLHGYLFGVQPFAL